MTTTLELHFSSDRCVALEKVLFCHPLAGGARMSVRGRLGGAYGRCLTFQWTPAVQALAMLAVATRMQTGTDPAILAGAAGSPAASLDYALAKQPVWLVDMFGEDSAGAALARRLIRRTNPERKRGGDVLLSINSAQLAPDQISVMVNGAPCHQFEALKQLSAQLLEQWDAPRECVREKGAEAAAPLRNAVRSEESALRLLVSKIVSSSARGQYLAQRLQDALLQELCGANSLALVSGESVLRDEESELPAAHHGTRLGCSFVTVGRVLLDGGRVQMALQLVASGSGLVAWARRIECREQELGKVQQRMLRELSAALNAMTVECREAA